MRIQGKINLAQGTFTIGIPPLFHPEASSWFNLSASRKLRLSCGGFMGMLKCPILNIMQASHNPPLCVVQSCVERFSATNIYCLVQPHPLRLLLVRSPLTRRWIQFTTLHSFFVAAIVENSSRRKLSLTEGRSGSRHMGLHSTAWN